MSSATASADGDCLAWAARDSSGLLSPYKFSRRFVCNFSFSVELIECITSPAFSSLIWICMTVKFHATLRSQFRNLLSYVIFFFFFHFWKSRLVGSIVFFKKTCFCSVPIVTHSFNFSYFLNWQFWTGRSVLMMFQ